MKSSKKNRLARNYDIEDDDEDYYSDKKSKRSHKSISKRDYDEQIENSDSQSDERQSLKKKSKKSHKKDKKSKKSYREYSSDSNNNSQSDSDKYSKARSKTSKTSKKSKKSKKSKSKGDLSDSGSEDEMEKERLRRLEKAKNKHPALKDSDSDNDKPKGISEDKDNEDKDEEQSELQKAKEEQSLYSEVYEFNKKIIKNIATPLNYDQPQAMSNANKISGFGNINKENEKKGFKQKFYDFLGKMGEQCCDYTLQRCMADCIYCFERQKVYKSEKYCFQCSNCMAIQGAAKQKPMPKVVYQKMHCGFCKKIFKYKPGYSVYIDCTLCNMQNYYPLDMQPKQPVLVQQQREYHKSMIQHQIEMKEKEEKEKEKKKEKNKLKEKEKKPLLKKKDKNSDDEDFYSD